MIPNVGIMEIAIVLVIALIVFGPKRLPELGKSLGRGISEFRDGVSSIGDSVTGNNDDEDDNDEPVELTPAAKSEAPDEDPEVTEVQTPEAPPEAEQVDGEVVAERRD